MRKILQYPSMAGTWISTRGDAGLDTIIEVGKLAKYRFAHALDLILHRLRPQTPKVLQRVPGDVSAGSRKHLCVFAHFDRDGMVDDYVTYYLSKLEEMGCEIIFISTAEYLDPDQIEKVRPFCSAIIVRENRGHDFGSWKAGFAEAGDISRYEHLIIANDSVYGPLFELDPLVDGLGPGADDVIGITDSKRFGHHLQSYFMVFGQSILRDHDFREFWRRLPYYRYKHSVILGCEVGLSRLLLRKGFNLRALCPVDSVLRRHLDANRRSGERLRPIARLDMTYLCWETLLRDFHCPFLKVRLLRDYSTSFALGERWRHVVSQCSRYDVRRIGRHLERFVPSRQV